MIKLKLNLHQCFQIGRFLADASCESSRMREIQSNLVTLIFAHARKRVRSGNTDLRKKFADITLLINFKKNCNK